MPRTSRNVKRLSTTVMVAAALLLTPACGDTRRADDPPATTSPTTASAGASSLAPGGAATTLAEGVEPTGTVTHETLSFNGRERTYRLYVPSRLPDGPLPLFFALHGGTGWGDQFADTNDVEDLAESNGFIVVHPDGIKIGAGPGGVWNGGVCCAVAARENVDDVGFTSALIDQVSSRYDIDPRRVFAFGHSNGGIMSYRLACELSDRIVGIGVVAGVLGVTPCNPAEPVSVMQVHGRADENVPFEGGVGPRSLAGIEFPPPHDGFETLAAANGCAAGGTSTAGDLTIEERGPCEADSAAIFVAIAGANHAWPGGTPIVEPAIGPAYAGYDATFEIVSFLLAHPRR